MKQTTPILLAAILVISTAVAVGVLAEDKPGADESQDAVSSMTVLLEDSRDKPAEKHTDLDDPKRVTANAAGEFTAKDDGFLIGKVNVGFESGVSISLRFRVYKDENLVWSDGVFVQAPRNRDALNYRTRFSLPRRDSFTFPVRRGDVVKWSYSRNPYDLSSPKSKFGSEFARLAFLPFPSRTQAVGQGE